MRAGAMEGRFIMDWNKDSVADAGFAKIDLLSLPVLDQLEEALDLIEKREGKRTRPGPDRPEGPQRLRHDQRGQGEGSLSAPVPGPAEDGPEAPLPQSAGPGLPGGPHPPRRGSPGQRRLPVRGAVQARGTVGVRPSPGGSGPWSGVAASSSGKSRWSSSSRTWGG